MRKNACKILETIIEYEKGIRSQDSAAIELIDYVKAYGTPIVCGEHVIFAYLGFAHEVAIVGDWNRWNTHIDIMRQIGITPVFYLVKKFPLDARLEYKLVVDGKRILDPYNQFVVKGKAGSNSELRMPNYKPPEFLDYTPVLSGRIRDLKLHFKRKVVVYTPPGYGYVKRKYPLLIVNDGSDYLKYAVINKILDFLISEGKIEPIIAVFVDPLDKIREYSLNKNYIEFLVYDVYQFVKINYDIVDERNKTCILGASLGGFCALYACLLYPRLFGCSISQSGVFLKKGELSSFGIDFKQDIFDIVKNYGKQPSKVFIDSGSYDYIAGIDLAKRNKEIANLLKSKGFTVRHVIVNQGHNWIHWRDVLPYSLEYIFGT